MKYKIVVVTLVTAGKLASAGNFSGGFGSPRGQDEIIVATFVTIGKFLFYTNIRITNMKIKNVKRLLLPWFHPNWHESNKNAHL